MEKSLDNENKGNESNFSKLGIAHKALISGAILTSAGIATLDFIDRKKKEKKEKRRSQVLDYLKTRINPRTLEIERDSGIIDPMNFALVPAALGFIGSTAAIIAGERAFDHFTSVDYRAKKKIEKKCEKEFNKWYNTRVKDYKNGKISKSQFVREKESKEKEYKEKAKKEYENWKEREEFIKESSRDYYNSLQESIPKTENFALFKDLIQNKSNENSNSLPLNSITVNPDVSGFIKLGATKSLLNGGIGIISNLFFKENTIKDSVKKMLFIEAKIDTLAISKEKKEEMKFDAFKEIISKFKNPSDIESFFKIKKAYSEKINKKLKIKGKNVNFDQNFLDNSDFSGWKKQKDI